MIAQQNKPKLSQQNFYCYVLGYQARKYHILEAQVKNM